MKEFKRTLKPGGMLYLSLWDGDTSVDSIVQRATQKLEISKHIVANELHSDLEKFYQLLSGAGFINLRIKKFTFVHVYDDLEQWWNSLWSHAYRGYLEQLDNNKLLQLKNETFNELKSCLNENEQLIEEMPIVFIEAKCSSNSD